jgi:murein DD-endopeptidase MepM/ murein hydrolase activator NlpD
MPWSKEKVPNGYGELIEQAATKEGLDPALLAGLLHWETRGKPFDRYSFNSSSRAAGLAQIDPITQRELKVKDPYNPQEAIPAAARYLKRLIDRFGSVEIGIRAYNQGPGATEKSPGGNSKESKEYPAGVLRTAATYGYGGSGMNREALVHPALEPFMAGDITSPMDLSGRVNPVTGKVKPHTGIDLGVDHKALHFNVPVRFNSSGWDENGYGNWMEFTLPNGNTVLTGHLSQIPKGFKPGMTISANKGVAVSGNTGRSTGPHLHFEERDTNGNIVDPSRPGGAMQFLLRS